MHTIIKSDLLYQNEIRLSASFYNFKYLEAMEKLKNSKLKFTRLDSFANVLLFGRLKRFYLANRQAGVPLLSTADMMQHEPIDLKCVKKKTVENYIVQKNWILVSRSGTIGNIAIVTDQMNGFAASEDAIRVVPKNELYTGFVYAYLSSKYGQEQIKNKISGSVQDHIYEDDVARIQVPLLLDHDILSLNNTVKMINQKRVKANSLLMQGRRMLNKELSTEKIFHHENYQSYHVNHISDRSVTDNRLDANFYAGYVGEGRKLIENFKGDKKTLEDLGYNTWYPSYLKTIFSENGIPYFTGGDLFMTFPKTDRKLSKNIKDIEERIVRKGMIVMQGSGQRYGLLGTPMLITEELDGVTVSHIMMRIEHTSDLEIAYLCCFLSSELGKRLIMQYATGTMIPYINDKSFNKMLIPNLDKTLRKRIGKLVQEAYSLRSAAYSMELQMRDHIEKLLE